MSEGRFGVPFSFQHEETTMFNEAIVGTVEGTGSAINVSCGFIPRYVKLFNVDDAGSEAPSLEWFTGMTDGYGLKNATTPGQTVITSGGISEYEGDDSNGEGFSIGTDSDLNASGETIHYIAIR